MLWLFAQNWLLLSVSFLAGAVLTWLCLLRPGRWAAGGGDGEPVPAADAAVTLPGASVSGPGVSVSGPGVSVSGPGVSVSGAPAAVSPAAGVVADPRYPGGARPLPCGSAPSAEFTVKSDADAMLYHAPASPAYRQVAADVWFRTEGEAQDAGFRPWDWSARITPAAPPAPSGGAGRSRVERQTRLPARQPVALGVPPSPG